MKPISQTREKGLLVFIHNLYPSWLTGPRWYLLCILLEFVQQHARCFMCFVRCRIGSQYFLWIWSQPRCAEWCRREWSCVQVHQTEWKSLFRQTVLRLETVLWLRVIQVCALCDEFVLGYWGCPTAQPPDLQSTHPMCVCVKVLSCGEQPLSSFF